MRHIFKPSRTQNNALKQYIYQPKDIGLSVWPSGELRLEGIDVTTVPSEADIFICPGNIRIFEGTPGTGLLDIHKMRRLPYFTGNESRHAFFDCSDNFKQSIKLPILFIKCDARQWMLRDDPNTIQVAWPVEDYGDCVELPDGGFKYDVSFQGWDSSQTRIDAAESCQKNEKLKCDFARYSDFTGYRYKDGQWDQEGLRRRQEFRRSMKESRVMLCGESIPGVMPYRFYEALSAGRIPFLIGSDYVLPFMGEIPYSRFIIRAEAKDASRAGEIVADFLKNHSDAELVEMGKLARYYWSTWLNSADWPRLMSYAVRRQLEKMGCTVGCG